MAYEVWLHVFKYLDLESKGRAALVCKEWRTAVAAESLWLKLDLPGRQDAARILQRLHQIPSFDGRLQEVNLEFAKGIHDEHVKLLAPYDIRVANFNACQKLTDDAFNAVLPCWPQLQVLSVYWNTHITDTLLFGCAACCPDLHHVNLSGCQAITEGGVATLAAVCTKITHLDLTRCMKLSDESVCCVARHCSALQCLKLYALDSIGDRALHCVGQLAWLEVLDVCGAKRITDEGLKALQGNTRLRVLNLSWCVQVGDDGVTCVAEHCTQLESLSLHGNKNVTDGIVDALAAGCGGTLHTLDVTGCINIHKRRPDELLLKLPRLEVFRIHK